MNAGPHIAPTAGDLLQAELRWLDLLIHREILRLRASYQLSLDELRGLYISDEQVDALVHDAFDGASDLTVMDLAAAEARVDRAQAAVADSPFARLSRELGLSRLEQDILIVVAAPEIDAKYETLYAYLNNDVARKAPTLQMVSRLLARDATAMLGVRAALTADAALLRSGVLRTIAPSEQQAWSTMAFKLHRALPAYLLGLGFRAGGEAVQPRDTHHADIDPGLHARLETTARAWSRDAAAAPIWLLHGRDRTLCEAAAGALCARLHLALLRLDLATLPAAPEDLAEALRDVLLRQRLDDAGLLVTGIGRLHDPDGRLTPEAGAALRRLRQARRPIFVDCETAALLAEALRGTHVISVAIPDLDVGRRAAAWGQALQARRLTSPPGGIDRVAEGFALAVDQIERAAQGLADQHRDGDPPEIAPADLAAAARACSDQSIARIAQRLAQPFDWDDLVLPAATIGRLTDIVSAIRDRQLVFGDWRLARRAGGCGLRVLFAGPSGTGKTMAAATLARELGVDVYRVDISQTVSKYIGETEKNLEKVFHAAAHSNGLLFFDEADALFGKRSEVKDAHDRYSNIETAFLLQRIEDYQGVVILASNLSRNMDTAFSRRLNFVLDFPLPDRPDRERLWRLMLADGPPVADDVDFDFLAAQFQLSGGEIRNVALDAAFVAAQSPERRITMRALIIALGRELAKQGRSLSAVDFKEHHALLLAAS